VSIIQSLNNSEEIIKQREAAIEKQKQQEVEIEKLQKFWK